MDFVKFQKVVPKKGVIKIIPDFQVIQSEDLMIQGRSFYAVWDEENKRWSRSDYDLRRLVDQEMKKYIDSLQDITDADGRPYDLQYTYLRGYNSGTWRTFKNYVSNLSDNFHSLDSTITFLNTEPKKSNYSSKCVNYNLKEGDYGAWDKLVGTLYEPEERAKIEWTIGSIISGESRSLQKFLVFYGEAGSGKSTIINIMQWLFEGYYTPFEAKTLTSATNAFATEMLRGNPLVAIQHDGDLSKIEDNTKLNSIVSHEEIVVNEKFKAPYSLRPNAFLIMATNRPVKITDAKSGIIRRLIDVVPSGNRIPPKEYNALMSQIKFELGAIAYHCQEVYRKMGKNYYNGYRPMQMIFKTDVFFNFVEANYFVFSKEDPINLTRAYDIYKNYCSEALVEYRLPLYKFREELKNYFTEFKDRATIDGRQFRGVYFGFLKDKFDDIEEEVEEHEPAMILDDTESLLDEMLADCPAQYANKDGIPSMKWSDVKSTLKDLDTTRLHYVKPPLNHIVIDFDLKDEKGEKSLERNLEEASKWPPTYAEFSKSESGIHLHYIFTGDPTSLSKTCGENIEIKVFSGNAALRRRLSRCRNIPIKSISEGLPRKERKMLNFEGVKSERKLRELILKNIRKEIHPGTKPSVDFIYKILEDAYNDGLKFDVTDLRPKILAFANNSSHQSDYCVKLVSKMKFHSDEPSLPQASDGDMVFFDVEVFPNLFLVNWKVAGEGKSVVRMINPSASEIENLMKAKLVGFNCRRYDNHILYARYIGYTIEELFDLSQRLVGGDSRNCMFGEAYNISYTDVYDFAAAGNKKSLKKFEIELGIHHQELGLPWDQPVPEDKWKMVAEYCDNDVIATEIVFNHLKGDWVARQILAELSGLTVNDTTNQHSTKIIFGDNKHPQDQFVYTDLREMFPGYKYERGISTYRGEEVGEGGYVYAEPGIYSDVALLDVASMHPTSIECLNLFGPYTRIFSEIKAARIAIKHKDFLSLESLMDGRLKKFVEIAKREDGFTLKDLSNALKTVINSVYGLTFAKFDNPFRDPRNIDNIVAKRGALFMVDLKHAVQEKGFTVAHIKTDSIKIPNATEEIIAFVMEFGESYGYTFEHEATYEKMCLVNDAVYVAKYKDGPWTATGAQFQHPVVFKTLFSHEPYVFEDYCETKTVQTALYLDMNEELPEDQHNYIFVGKAGSFVPVLPGSGGGILLREKEGKYYAATGTKGYRWLESEMVRKLDMFDRVDPSYSNELVIQAKKDISKYGDVDAFIESDSPPWDDPCLTEKNCNDCDKMACPLM